ncbi:MAG: hypothetical protein GY830_09015 [Bacteroidetes bacterium]|nr:hypothetical protein [Bacteroidota bacterium]
MIKRAFKIVLVHNHPSGNLSPSMCDIEVTGKLIQVGNFIDIAVVDHIIFSEDGYYSFKDDNLIFLLNEFSFYNLLSYCEEKIDKLKFWIREII